MQKNGNLAKTTVEDYVEQVCKWAGPNPDVLIGASMGGVLALKAAESIHPKRLVLVCTAIPGGFLGPRNYRPDPPIVRWKGGPYKDTLNAMPDSDEETRQFAFTRWRDESGSVITRIRKGVYCRFPACPVLCVIPENDNTVKPEDQQKVAQGYKAKMLCFPGMSHVGPLLSRRAPAVADEVLAWLAKKP